MSGSFWCTFIRTCCYSRLSSSILMAADYKPSCLWVGLYNNPCYCNDEPVEFPIQSSPSKANFTYACAAAMRVSPSHTCTSVVPVASFTVWEA